MTRRGHDHDPADTLRSMPHAPDLSQTILARVEKRRGFLSRRGRAILRAARWGAAAVVVGFLAGALIVGESQPVADLTGRDTSGPAARVVDAVAAEGVGAVRHASGRVIEISSGAVRESVDRALRVAARRAAQRLDGMVISVAPPYAAQSPAIIAAAAAPAGTPQARTEPWIAGATHPTGQPLTWPAALSDGPIFPAADRDDAFAVDLLVTRR